MRLQAYATSILILAGLSACGKHDASTRVPLAAAPTPLAATPSTTLAQICGAQSQRAWQIVDTEAQVLGVTRGRCLAAGSDEAAPWRVEAQLSQDGRPRYELLTWLSDAGKPVAAQLRDGKTTRYYHWDAQQLVETHLGDSRSLPLAKDQAPTFVLPSHALYLRELMVRLGVGNTGTHLHQLSYAPDQDSFSTLDLEARRTNANGDGSGGDDDLAVAGIAGAKFEFRGAKAGLGGLSISSVRGADGQEIYRAAPADAQDFELSLPELPQPSYRLAAGLEVLAVPVPASKSSPALGAELVRAVIDEGDESAPRPAVLFISGAGPQDRLGFVPQQGIDVGSHEIHDALARAGFSVLRFDDRGVGQSEVGDDVTPGFLDTVDDARRAWQALGMRDDVDPKRITLIGHGEGALVAMLLAQEKIKRGRKSYAPQRLVVLAAPGRNTRELIYDEIRRSHSDRHETEVESAVYAARQIHDAALADKDLPASSEPLRDWMREIFALEPLSLLEKVKVPVLALQGEKDFQVSAQRDFLPIAEALEKRGDQSRALSFPMLDHLFKVEPESSKPGHYRDLGRHVDNELLQSLVSWMTQNPGA